MKSAGQDVERAHAGQQRVGVAGELPGGIDGGCSNDSGQGQHREEPPPERAGSVSLSALDAHRGRDSGDGSVSRPPEIAEVAQLADLVFGLVAHGGPFDPHHAQERVAPRAGRDVSWASNTVRRYGGTSPLSSAAIESRKGWPTGTSAASVKAEPRTCAA